MCCIYFHFRFSLVKVNFLDHLKTDKNSNTKPRFYFCLIGKHSFLKFQCLFYLFRNFQNLRQFNYHHYYSLYI